MLPGLARWLTVAIPRPRVVLGPCEAAPFGAIAYPRLPGRLMTREDALGPRGQVLAEQLAEALSALHSVEPQAIDNVQLVPRSDPGHHARLWEVVRRPLEQRLPPGEWAAVREWWESFLASGVPGWPHRTLSHGDPWWENLLVDDTSLTGILDWEYLSVSDPANDLGVTLQMGEPFFQRLLTRYREVFPRDDPTLENRARLLAASRVFYGFEFAIVRSDDGEWEDSLASLRQGPILSR